MTGGTGRWSWGRWTGALVVAGLVAAAGLVGCSASGSKSSNGSAAQAPAKAQPNQAGAADNGAPAAGAGGQVLKPGQVPANELRQIIYTGQIALQVSSVDDAANRLVSLAAGAGGYVSADQRSIDAGRSSASVTVRVPADKFDSSIAAISELGTEQSRNISSQDVTAQAVDLDSRVKTQQASVDRIRALLAQAKSISDITSVESELTRRESDLESLQAQLAALTDQAALSSITVNLYAPDAVPPPAKPKAKPSFLHGLSGGWHAFLAFLAVLLMVIGAVLPFAIAFGVPAAAVLWYLRRRARLHPRPAPVPAAPLAARPSIPVAPPYPGTRPVGFPAPSGPRPPAPPQAPPAAPSGPPGTAGPSAPGGPPAAPEDD